MSINIIHLVSGEQVVSKVAELRDPDGEPFCFLLQMPMTLTLIPGDDGEEPQLNFFPWSPFSGSKEFRVAFDKIISVGQPTRQVYETYVELNQPVYPILTPEEFESFVKSKKEKQSNERNA